MSDSGSSNWASEAGEFEDINGGHAVCLFCTYETESIVGCWKHIHEEHSLDTIELKNVIKSIGIEFDDYVRMRMVNFVRKSVIDNIDAVTIISQLKSDASIWSNETYLVPVNPEDRLLWEATPAQGFSEDDFDADIVNNDIQKHVVHDGPEESIESLKAELARVQATLRRYMAVEDEESSSSTSSAPKKVSIIKDEGLLAKAEQRREFTKKEDVAYFESYSFDDIHRIMILDEIRTGSYKAFLTQNPAAIKGKTVLDVGCGSGILSMFCAAAGAKRVVGLDAAAVTAAKARRNVELNGLADRVQVVVGKVEDMELWIDTTTDKVEPFPVGEAVDETRYERFQCDVLVSEWMGYGLLFEGMLYSVIHARDKWLRDGGLVAPSQTTLALHGVDYAMDWKRERAWFKPGQHTFGLDLRMLAPQLAKTLKDPEIEVCPKERVRTGLHEVCTIDLALTSAATLRGLRMPFCVPAEGRAFSSLALSFDTIFEPNRRFVKAKVGLTEGPDASVRTRSLSERLDTAIHWRSVTPTLLAEVEAQAPSALKHKDGRAFVGTHGDECDRIDEALVVEDRANESEGRTVVFGTSPEDPPTHWKQFIMHLINGDKGDQAIVRPDGEIKGWLSVAPAADNPRHIDVTLEVTNGSLEECDQKLQGVLVYHF